MAKVWKRKQTGEYYVTLSGKQHSLGKDRRDAEAKARRLLREAGFIDTSDITVHDLCAEYTKWVGRNRASATAAGLRVTLQSLCAAYPKGHRASTVTPGQIDTWASHGTRVLKPSTIATKITSVIAMFNWAVKFGYVKVNPVAKLPKPTACIRRDYLSDDQLAKAIAACPAGPIRDAVAFLADTGCRIQEYRILEAEYFDRVARRFVIPSERSKGRKTPRTIYLPAESFALADAATHRYPVGPCFRSPTERPWTAANLGAACRFIKDEIKMPGFRLTDLRHSFAHRRLVRGQDPVVVAKLMGHSSTDMIYKRYGHLDGTDFLAAKADEYALNLP